MITKDRISAWLDEPHQLQEVSPKALVQLVRDYPYFAPAHYLKWIGAQQSPDALFVLQQTYPVNPVLLGRLLSDAAEQPVIVTEPVQLPAEDAVPEVIEEKAMEPLPAIEATDLGEEMLVQPVSAEDYFLQQGIHVSGDLPELKEVLATPPPETEQKTVIETEEDKEKALMVVMSFAEWLKHISSKNLKEKEEEAEQKALKAMWQQQKLAAAIEEESEEIPEQVFEMAVNSISRKEEWISESMAEVYVKQGKKEKAIEIYHKLSLQNPEKNAYFAAKIENLQKDI